MIGTTQALSRKELTNHKSAFGNPIPTAAPTTADGSSRAHDLICEKLLFTIINLNSIVNKIHSEIEAATDSATIISLKSNYEFFKAQRYRAWDELRKLNSSLLKGIHLQKDFIIEYENLPAPPYALSPTDANQIEILGFSPHAVEENVTGDDDADVPIRTLKEESVTMSTESPAVKKHNGLKSSINGHSLVLKPNIPAPPVMEILTAIKNLSQNELRQVDPRDLQDFYKQVALSYKQNSKKDWVALTNLVFESIPLSSYNTEYDFRFDILETFYKSVFQLKPSLPIVLIETNLMKEIGNWLSTENAKKNRHNVGIILRFLCSLKSFESKDFGIHGILQSINTFEDPEIKRDIQILCRTDSPNFSKPPIASNNAPLPSSSTSTTSTISSTVKTSDTISTSATSMDATSAPSKSLSNSAYSRRQSEEEVSKPLIVAQTSSAVPAGPTATSKGPAKLAFTSYMASKKTKPAEKKSPSSTTVSLEVSDSRPEPVRPADAGALKSCIKSKPATYKKKVAFKADAELVSIKLIDSNKNANSTHKSAKELNSEEGGSFSPAIPNSPAGREPIEEQAGEIGWNTPKFIKYDDILALNPDVRAEYSIVRGGTLSVVRRPLLDEELKKVVAGRNDSDIDFNATTPFEPENGLITEDKSFPNSDYDNTLDSIAEELSVSDNSLVLNEASSKRSLGQEDESSSKRQKIEAQLPEPNSSNELTLSPQLPTPSVSSTLNDNSISKRAPNLYVDSGYAAPTQPFEYPHSQQPVILNNAGFPMNNTPYPVARSGVLLPNTSHNSYESGFPPPIDNIANSQDQIAFLRQKDVREYVRAKAWSNTSKFNVPCKFFQTRYHCKRGDDCFYLHIRD